MKISIDLNLRCDDNPYCRWYSWNVEDKLCYLKGSRGYLLMNTTSSQQFTSGATFRDGCEPDPPCSPPYHLHNHQCLHIPPHPSSFQAGRQLCQSLGGELTSSYEGWRGEVTDDWYWVNTNHELGKCYACRPHLWSLGVKRLPCEQQLHFACNFVLTSGETSNYQSQQRILGIETDLPNPNHSRRSKYVHFRRNFRSRSRFLNPFLNFVLL